MLRSYYKQVFIGVAELMNDESDDLILGCGIYLVTLDLLGVMVSTPHLCN